MNKPYRQLLLVLLALAPAQGKAAPQWIEQASRPGPDQATAGQSRFDQLFQSEDGHHQIPYPFEELIAFLETRVNNGKKNAVRQVLIPIGRSLQRHAPAPNYFSFPRSVITLEGEPMATEISPQLVMEYRLFIAHQPHSNNLEVISYNDSAGRFEFQVVDNYNNSGTPRVRPANRVMCLSCHQNAAPVFATKPWSETNFSTRIASRLIESLPQKYPSLIEAVGNDADVMDVLIERANYLSAAQYIWKHGCNSINCRAAMLRAVLQYRLSGKSSFDRNSEDYQRHYMDELSRNWARQWPQGLALASSRIPDRDPFMAEYGNREEDPLFERPAHASWQGVDPILTQGIIYRLSGFLTLEDVQRIDRQLVSRSQQTNPVVERFRAGCRIEAHDNDSSRLICGDQGSARSFQARFEIDRNDATLHSLRVVSLQVPGDNNIWQPRVSSTMRHQNHLEIDLLDASVDLSQRLANGDRISRLQLQWENPFALDKLKLGIEVTREFHQVEQALAGVIAKHHSGAATSFQTQAFIRQQLMTELMQELGMATINWQPSRITATGVPEPDGSNLDGDLALLEPYCGHCHGNATLNPPGFLNGPEQLRQVRQCAPRILARLKAWDQESALPLSPMPPPASLGYSGSSSRLWPTSNHYLALVAAIETQVDESWQAVVTEVSQYQKMPDCLKPD